MLAWFSIVGVTVFVTAVVALHLLPTGLDPVRRTVSEYVNQPYGWLVPIAGAAIGLGSLALTAALSRVLPVRPRAGLALLAVWGVAMCVVAAFPTDPKPSGRLVALTANGAVHVAAGAVAFVTLALAAPLVSRALPPARTVRVLAASVPVSLAVFALTMVNHPPVSRLVGQPTVWGAGERLMMAIYAAWLLAVSIRVVRT